MLMRSCAIVIVLLVSVTPTRADTTLYVDDDAPFGGDGLSWETAFDDLQDAIDAAEELGEAVETRIAGGLYLPTHRTDEFDPNSVTFALRDEMTLLGGFAGLSGENPDDRDMVAYATILSDRVLAHSCCREHDEPGCLDASCEEQVCSFAPECCDLVWDEVCVDLAEFLCTDICVDIFGNATNIMTIASLAHGAALDGLVFRGAGIDENEGPLAGAEFFTAITVIESRLEVRQCTFERMNKRAVSVFDGELIASSSLFHRTGSFNADGGGAIRIAGGSGHIEDCTFRGHWAFTGGAIYAENTPALSIDGCRFFNNTAASRGGAIYLVSSPATITSCEFENNSADNVGGGAISNLLSDVLLMQCSFNGNTAEVGQVFNAGGGAIHNEDCAPSIIECTFVGNKAVSDDDWDQEGAGGAVYNFRASSILIECLFENNLAAEWGGAVWTRNTVEPILRPVFVDCEFLNNQATGQGGGAVYNFGLVAAVIIACDFTNNKARWGGGLAEWLSMSHVVGCDFAANRTTALMGAGAICLEARTTFTNCTFRGNDAPDHVGGGVAVLNSSDVKFLNCTLHANQARFSGGGIFVGKERVNNQAAGSSATVWNSTLWGNVDQAGQLERSQIFVDDAPESIVAVNYSCIEGLTGTLGGVGNIGDDPLFVDPLGADGIPGTEDDDLHLGAGSPGIDAAFNNAVPDDVADLDGDGDVSEFLPFDFDGEPRFADDARTDDTGCGAPAIVDMGAYEFPGIPIQPIRGDITGDLLVDGADLIELLGSWGECPTEGDDTCCAADLNANGLVDGGDLLILLGNWG